MLRCQLACELNDADARLSAIVPTAAVSLLAELTREGTAELRFSENQLEASGGSWVMCARLIEANYPNYRQVIPAPEALKKTVAIPRRDALRALGLTDVYATEKSLLVKLAATKGRVEFCANTPDVGEARTMVESEQQRDEVTVAYNPAFLRDALESFEADALALRMQSAMEAGLIEHGEWTSILMPMRVS
jgi:DNA polymerase-3 subunit beta